MNTDFSIVQSILSLMKLIIIPLSLLLFLACQVNNGDPNVIEIEMDSSDNTELIQKKYPPVEGKDSIFLNPIDLIDKIIEFQGLTPNRIEWDLTLLKSNPPRFYLLQQIQALILAFNNEKVSLSQFIQGDFIEQRQLSEYNLFIQKIIDDTADEESSFYERNLKRFNEEKSVTDIKEIFKFHFDFLVELDKLSGSKGLIGRNRLVNNYAYTKRYEITDSINSEKVKDLKEGIALIINPHNKSFSMKELVEKHGYPDLDLHEVNVDWY